MDVVYIGMTNIGYVAALVNLLFMPYFVWTLCRAKLMHGNLKYLLGITIVSTCVPGLIRALMDVMRNYFPDYLLVACIICNPIYSFINGLSGIGFFLIFVERFYATKRSESYEQNTIPFITIFTIVFVIFGAVFIILTLLYDKNTPEIYPLNDKSCLSLERRLWAPIFGWSFYFILTFPVIPSMHKLAQHNLRLLKSPVVGTLSGRYQQSENVKALRTIVNSFVITNLLFGGVAFSAFCYILYAISTNMPLDYNILVATRVLNLAMDIGSFCFGFILILYHPTLDKRLHTFIRNKHMPWSRSQRAQSSRNISNQTEADIYFKQLSESWNK